MEDQQPAAGDLTDGAALGAEQSEPDASVAESESDDSANGGESAYAAEESAEDAPGEIDGDTAEQAGGGAEAEGEAEQDAQEENGATAATEDGGARTRRPPGKRTAIVVAVAAVLFVGSAAFAGATVQPYLADRATVATKLRVARTAANAITTLWTYTPENMDSLADRAATYLTGDFGAQYRRFVDAIAAPNKQAKITNSTVVTGAAVESLDEPHAIAIVYTNTTSTSPLTKDIPSLKYLSYRLIMKRSHARWLVTRMTTITSLDLTPHV